MVDGQMSMTTNNTPDNSELKRESRFLAWWIWLVYTLLIIAGVPWYWPAEFEGTLFGIPTWTLCSLAASLAASCFTAWLLLTRWPVESKKEENSTNENDSK